MPCFLETNFFIPLFMPAPYLPAVRIRPSPDNFTLFVYEFVPPPPLPTFPPGLFTSPNRVSNDICKSICYVFLSVSKSFGVFTFESHSRGSAPYIHLINNTGSVLSPRVDSRFFFFFLLPTSSYFLSEGLVSQILGVLGLAGFLVVCFCWEFNPTCSNEVPSPSLDSACLFDFILLSLCVLIKPILA